MTDLDALDRLHAAATSGLGEVDFLPRSFASKPMVAVDRQIVATCSSDDEGRLYGSLRLAYPALAAELRGLRAVVERQRAVVAAAENRDTARAVARQREADLTAFLRDHQPWHPSAPGDDECLALLRYEWRKAEDAAKATDGPLAAAVDACHAAGGER